MSEEVVNSQDDLDDMDNFVGENELDVRIRAAQFTLVRYISMYDIKRGGVIWRDLTQEKKDECLWSVGLNVKGYRYITNKDEHVTIDGTRWEGVRFICNERGDYEWITSGFASEEAELSYRNDPSLSREIYKLKDCYAKFGDMI